MVHYIDDDFDRNQNGEKYQVGPTDGHIFKKFVRINDCSDELKKSIKDKIVWKKTLQDSKYFAELFESMRQNNCSYVTYFDDLIKGKSDTDVYYPNYVSCLAKTYAKNDTSCATEVIGSRIANALGVHTVYNFCMPKKNYCERSGELQNQIDSYVFSVDFMQAGFDIISLESLGVDFKSQNIVFDHLEEIVMAVQRFARNNYINLSNDDLYSIKRDFCIEYMFKKILCGDTDFCGRNVSIMYNKSTGKCKLAPSYDFEYIFDFLEYPPSARTLRNEFMSISREFPRLVDDFYNKVIYLDESGVFEKIFDERYFTSSMQRIDFYNRFKNNISLLKTSYEQFKKREEQYKAWQERIK